VSEINVLGSDVAATASSDEHPADQAGMAVPAPDNGTAPRRRGGLSGMVMAELRQLASQLGVPGIAGMRKNELIAAIKERQGTVPGQRQAVAEQLTLEDANVSSGTQTRTGTATRTQDPPPPVTAVPAAEQPPAPVAEPTRAEAPTVTESDQIPAQQDREQQDVDTDAADRSRNRRRRPVRNGDTSRSSSDQATADRNQPQGDQAPTVQGGSNQNGSQVAASPNGSRDAITGAVRQPREGEQQRQKFNPLVRVDTINGLDLEQARRRPEFTKLTPLYPNERLRLETEQGLMTTRVIDLIMPIGKGQRALIVSPPKAGKTMILQALANAITKNNPECHLMVVLVDERPEEVTDMQRSVKGEVIASTFDRPPSDHTTISELAIERAKRLVEMGHDVVVLLDSITRLGRAYNLAAPASGRILSGGVDSTALYPPKRFLGAARNIEDGGSLTIFATALVETGSTMDTVIFEEFKGTGNAELKLDRKIADKRIFPAIDINPSGTRKEELLLSPDELAIHHKLRRVLSGLESQQAIDLVLDRLRKTRTNIEFLMQVSKSAAGNGD
jgi:transcription termination factor Rho